MLNTIQSKASANVRTASTLAQPDVVAVRRRPGRPKKNARAQTTSVHKAAPSNWPTPQGAGSVTRAGHKAAPQKSLSAPSLGAQQTLASRRADDAPLALSPKRMRQCESEILCDNAQRHAPRAQIIDLEDVARGFHALVASLEAEQAQSNPNGPLVETKTILNLDEVQAGFDALLTRVACNARLQPAQAVHPAPGAKRAPWVPGQPIDRTTLGAAVRHLEAFGLTAAAAKQCFVAQPTVSAGFALLGALVCYVPELRRMGLLPVDIVGLCAPKAKPLGRAVALLDAWHHADLDKTSLLAVALHEGGDQTLNALRRHLKTFVEAGGEVDSLIQAYHHNAGPHVIETMVRTQKKWQRDTAH